MKIKMLLTGYATPESLSYMSFLDSAQYTYDNYTNQLYAVTDMLTTKKAGVWQFNFSSGGYYSDYSVTFFLPAGSEVIRFERSHGLNFPERSYPGNKVLMTSPMQHGKGMGRWV